MDRQDKGDTFRMILGNNQTEKEIPRQERLAWISDEDTSKHTSAYTGQQRQRHTNRVHSHEYKHGNQALVEILQFRRGFKAAIIASPC